MTKRTTQFYLLTLLFLLCTATTALAQRRVEGRVVDNETGETLPGVNLVTRNGTYAVTDEKGTYNLSITRGDSVTVSYVGYEPQTLPAFYLIDHHEIRLKTGAELREVVVTASIASARNAKAVGSKIDKVDVERLMDQGTGSNLADIIDGRISGVQMFQSNGKVGMPIRFNMRSGATLSMDRDPIIYVDGVRYNNSHTSDINTSQDAMSSLNDLPLEDIASIDVIKGPAAAASYGAEAANGVIVITTKRRSSAAADGGNLTGTVKFTQGVNTLARRYTQFVNNDDINNFFVNGNITRVYANLSKRFSPGNQLYFSLDENHTAGIIPGNRDVRHALMAAYDVTQDKFGMNVSLRYINGSLSVPQTAQGKNDAIWNLMRTQKPWGYVSERTWRAQSWTYDNDRVIGQARLSYLLPGAVKVETLLGMDVNFIRGEYLLPYGYLLNTNDKGARNVSNRRNSTLNWDIKANRRFDLGGGWQTTLTLLSQIVRRYETVNTVSTSVFSGNVTQLSAASEKQVSESDFEQRTWGLYGEAFFNYRNTLFINAGLRRDASNLIGANVASIYYPSLSVSYNQQAFKWRAAYGESGRLPYPTDAHTAYALTGSSAYGPLVAPSTQGNPNIRPERMREIELGTDVNLKRHRIGLSLYGQFTSDAIIYVPLRSSLGWLGSRPENIGSVRGYGFELNWNGTVWENRRAGNALDLFVSVNGQTNEVTNTGGRTIENLPNVIKEGQPAYAFYYKKVEGARYDAKGVYKGAQESKEYEYLGKPFPTLNGAVGFELKLFHNLTFNARVNYATGASVYNQSYYNVAGLGDNLKKREDLKAALAKETPGTDAYRATAEQLAHTERNRDNYIEKADFIRLSSLSAGYDFSSPVRRATHQLIKTCRLMLSAQNLILITNYSGAEPQIEANGGTRQTRGIGSLSRDITNAPAPRSFTASLTIGF